MASVPYSFKLSAHPRSSRKVSEQALSSETMAETSLDKLTETIDDEQAKIGDRIHALLLLLRSRYAKEENHEDQSPNDKEGVEMEVGTESLTQVQVPVSKLEPGLRINNASPTDCEDSQCVVGFDGLFGHEEAMLQVSDVQARVVVLTKSTSVTNNQIEHQLFDKMPLRVQSKRRHLKGHKSWRFKFKQRKQHRGKPRTAHKLNYRGNVMYKYLSSNAKGALMKKNKFSTTWSTLKDDCFMEDDQVYQETLPPWLLVRFKFWKFKLMNKNLQKMMREHGYSSYLKLKSDVGDDDDGMFSEAKVVSMRFLLGIMLGITETNHASEGQQAVFEQILMVIEWLQTSFVIQQVMRNKKIRLSKRWWFKYRFGEEDQGSLQSRTEYSLSIREILTFISQAEALLSESKVRTEKQIPNLQFLKQINISHYRWTQEEPDVIRFLLRRHLHLHLDCKEPELSGRKRNHGVLIRLHSRQKQRKCSKCWMFKFRKKKIDHGLGYNLIVAYLENKKTWTKLRVRKHDNLSWKEDASDESRSRSSRCIVEEGIKRLHNQLRYKCMLELEDWPKPETIKQLRGFWGLAGYYRSFVKGFGSIASPLHALTKKDNFSWTPEAQGAFDQMKAALCQAPVLALPLFDKEIVVETDASGGGMGAVLMQDSHSVAYISRQPKGTQLHLSIYEKELLVVVIVVQKWRHYLLPKHFIIKTDQRSLKYLLKQRLNTPSQQQWLPKLLEFDYEIQYKQGKENLGADALSRVDGSEILHMALTVVECDLMCPHGFLILFRSSASVRL